jgi:hypothetical protein
MEAELKTYITFGLAWVGCYKKADSVGDCLACSSGGHGIGDPTRHPQSLTSAGRAPMAPMQQATKR